MAPKKPPPKPTAKPKSKPAAPATRLQNLAAKPPSFDELTMDDQLVDHSGVFRVTSAISQAQTGHDEEQSMRFPNDSLVMAAQRDGFRDEPSIDPTKVEEDAAVEAEKRQRVATLAERARALREQRSRRR